jgi:hypothetical protein
LLHRSSNNLADQDRGSATGIRLKISGYQIVRTPASADVDPGSGGAYPITVGIERVQKTRLIRTGIWLNALQRAFVYEKRCLYRAIVSPKSHGLPRPVI